MSLFGKKKEETPSPFTDRPASTTPKGRTILGKNLSIKGTLSGDDDVQLSGTLEGDIRLKTGLTVGQSAKIKGEVSADMIQISGTVDGTVTAKSKLQLDQSAKVSGTISTPKLTMLEGAVFNGDVQMNDKPTYKIDTKPTSGPATPPKNPADSTKPGSSPKKN